MNTPAESSADRRARVARLVEAEKAAGRPIPRGLKLIDFERHLTPRVLARARSLEGRARELLAGNRGAVAA